MFLRFFSGYLCVVAFSIALRMMINTTWPTASSEIRFLVLLLLLAGVSAALAYLFDRPLKAMRRACQRWEEGERDFRMAPALTARNDSIGSLSRAMNAMADTIEAEQMRRELLFRNISHELRSPLARLRLANALMVRNCPAVHEDGARVDIECARMDTLIGDILTLARLEQPHAGEPGRHFALRPALADLVRDMAFECHAVGRPWSCDEIPDVHVSGDASDLRLCLENLIRNARLHGAGMIELRAAQSADMIEIAVLDQGDGIGDIAPESLMQPFARRQASSAGSGLGLSIARAAARRLGSDLSLTNRPDGGLLARISLPLHVMTDGFP